MSKDEQVSDLDAGKEISKDHILLMKKHMVLEQKLAIAERDLNSIVNIINENNWEKCKNLASAALKDIRGEND